MSVSSIFVIIVCVGAILILGIYQLIRRFKQNKEVLHESEMIQQKLIEIQKVDDITERFNQMNDWILNQESKYVKNYVVPAWKSFHQKYMSQGVSLKLVPDVYDFFVEEELVHKYGNRKFVELIPGMFLSIGILGTFASLAVGVGSLDLNANSENMRAGVSSLLSGMQSKFASSIFGIFASITWQSLDKKLFLPRLQHAYFRIRDSFDEAFPTQDQNTFLVQMLENQKNQMNDFQVFMSEQMIPQMINGFNQSLNQSLLPPMEKTQELMNELITSASVNQMDGVKQLTSEVMNSLNDLTGEHMKQLGEALEATVEWQKKVHEEMTGLVDSMQEAAKNQSEMVDKTTVLTQEIHNYTDNITNYQKVLEGTVAQLNDTTSTNSELQSATSSLLGKIIEERNVFNAHFDEHISKLQTNVVSIVDQTEKQVVVQELLGQNLERISEMTLSQEQLAVSLSEQASHTQSSSEELGKLLIHFENNAVQYNDLQEKMGDMLQQAEKDRRVFDQLVERIQTNLAEQVEDMDERVEYLGSLWSENKETMDKLSKQLSTSMSQFTDDMHRGIMRTFEKFDEELTTSVNLLAKGVDSMRDGLVDMPDVIQELKQSVIEINNQAKRATTV
ncbi:hypothetical protein PUW24_11665 [Paenibacillus urinalis]|uniref:MotA/TolQ/ExbB proton channel domain-containing protein n=1 Tax=Paenibacillus urinalis TaxID=521520 RepID=A0AAX3N157_9BACL|nr:MULTISPECIES: hypothetical protein [Paenibacillus]WDH83441.1 hypothetical protein PUW23_04135 [Paenibacillus urinalis]WDH99487.1 hypothetical protein PUW24_11665 [Paenibacillus urinalis]WDI03120.1 hypothetical protein PUW25_03810 [Paenibacillus urinalis]GAK41823.1 hypothetical protein TCA2_4315 [Paenibacillus sp. TCA20]